MVLAKYFDGHAKIVKTIYPGLESHPENVKLTKSSSIVQIYDIVYGKAVSLVFQSKLELDSFVDKINLFFIGRKFVGRREFDVSNYT